MQFNYEFDNLATILRNYEFPLNDDCFSALGQLIDHEANGKRPRTVELDILYSKNSDTRNLEIPINIEAVPVRTDHDLLS